MYAEVLPTVRAMHAEGKSLRAIAAALNAEGRTTMKGLPWNPVQVSRLVKSV